MSGFEVVILAGGLGMRLRSEVPGLPKPMAPVAGIPFLEHLLRCLVAQGATRFVLSIGYLAEKVTEYFGESFQGVEVLYVSELEPLGTGGAISKAMRSCSDDYFLVLNGDTFLEMDYVDFLKKSRNSKRTLGIAVRSVADTARYGRCCIDGDVVVGFGEKSESGPGFINAGVYAVSSNIFDGFFMGEKFSFELDFISQHLENLRPYGYPTHGYFIDIGVPDDYVRAQHELPALSVK